MLVLAIFGHCSINIQVMTKRYFLSFILLGAVLGLPCAVAGQTKAEQKAEKVRKVQECLRADSFAIEVSNAMTMGGHNVSLSPFYSLKVRNDSVFSYLPYYGRAYYVPYDGGQGLTFDTKMQGYTKTQGKGKKKGLYEIRFSARTAEDYYTFMLEVYENGSASIHVSSQNRQPIDYLGEVVLDEDEKK